MNKEINTFLSFRIGSHILGVDVSKVLEISEYRKPQSVPESPAYVLGAIEFGDQLVPLIDAGLKFGIDPIEINEVTCMIVLELYNSELSKKYKASIVVDAVTDVFESAAAEKLSMEDDFKPQYMQATYKTDSGMVMVINADKVFSEKEIIALGTLMGSRE